MKTLASTLAVLFCFLVLPGLASANTFYVNTLEPEAHEPLSCVEVSLECGIRDAIERANENEGVRDTINFEAILGGTIELESQLPAIAEGLTIDGTTAGDYDGTPVIEIDASGAAAEYGLRIDSLVGEGSVGGTQIKGIAVTGAVGPGIYFAEDETGAVCASYVGVDTAGAAAPNGVGIQVGGEAFSTKIGGVACGNLISGNEGAGIVDEGLSTGISNNLIGTDAGGEAALPNGGPGIEVTTVAGSTAISPVGEGDGGNTIAFNGGAGVLVEDGIFATEIYANSIFDNGGLGIEIEDNAPPAPTIKSFQREPFTAATGTIAGAPNTQYYIDLYANEECDPSGAGEGRSYIGFESVTTDASGLGQWNASDLFAAPPGEDVITATATSEIFEVGDATSEFSKCFPEKEVPPAPPTPPAPPVQTLVALEPVNGESLAAEPLEGVIYIKLPGKGKQVKLTEGMLIPVGSVIDATKGKVTLTSVNKAGETQTAVFFGGRFLVAQRDGSGLVTLQLRGALKGCKKAGSSSATISAAKGRRLWGSGKGKFRTEGNYGSATVRGTVWLTEDRCRGTFFKTKKGVVTVRDFSANETFPLGKGKSYLATP